MSEHDSSEIWKPVEWCPGCYVSNLGRVIGLSGRILKGSPNDAGYPCVRLCKKGGTRRVHRIVFEAFIGPIPPGIEINHLNGIKSDARPENLELATRQQNVDHSIHVLGNKHIPPLLIGEKAHFSKLTAAKVGEIRALRGKMSYKEVAQRYGVSYPSVYKIWRGESWKHI